MWQRGFPYPDADAGELVHGWDAALGARTPLAVGSPLPLILGLAAFGVSLLHHQRGFASWDQLLEDLAEIFRHLRGSSETPTFSAFGGNQLMRPGSAWRFGSRHRLVPV